MLDTTELELNKLPNYIDYEIEYEDGTLVTWKFFLNISRDAHGKWAVGYVHYPSDELVAGEVDEEMVIPDLFFNSADSLKEIAVRMAAKIERHNRRNVKT